MKIRDSIGSLLKFAVLIVCIYGIVKWDPFELTVDDVSAFAERACIDEIRSRYNASTVSVYNFTKSDNGYVIRASFVAANGKRAKGICLSNAHGGVREITIEQR